MKNKKIFQIGVFLMFFGILAVGQVTAATVSDFDGGFSSQVGWTGLLSDKSATISEWINMNEAKSKLIADIPVSPLPDIGKLIQDKQQAPIEWDPDFMSRTYRNAHTIPSCCMI
jgi:hypothetical protein